MLVPVVTDDRGVSGTSGVDGVVVPGTDDDVFAEAFDTAQDEGEKADLSAADDPKNLKEEEEKVEPPAKTAEEIAAETKAAEAAVKVTPVDDAEKVEQKYRTLQGILKHDKEAWEAERTTLLSQLEEAKKTPATVTKTPTKEEATGSETFEENLTDEQKEELDAYEESFDVVSKMEGLKRERELKKLRKEMQDWKADVLTQLTDTRTRIEPAMKLVQANETETHFNAIRDGYVGEDGVTIPGHNDYEQFVGDGSLKAWIEKKPAYIRKEMQRVYEHGTVQDAIDLISDFKRENDISSPAKLDNVVDLEARKAGKKAALTAVLTRKAAVATGSSFKDDFDGAFDEALNKSGG